MDVGVFQLVMLTVPLTIHYIYILGLTGTSKSILLEEKKLK